MTFDSRYCTYTSTPVGYVLLCCGYDTWTGLCSAFSHYAACIHREVMRAIRRAFHQLNMSSDSASQELADVDIDSEGERYGDWQTVVVVFAHTVV